LEGQHNVTDEQYHTIVKTHLTELWTRYGELTEIWIDSKLQGFGTMMDRLQPNAEGSGSGSGSRNNNPRQWCGTESGFPSRDVGNGPIWQTGTGFFGNSTSEQWVDKFCDPQLFVDHIWFYEPGRRVKRLEEMIPIYHDIVGRGMIMELAFAINRQGLVEESHERVYKQLGNWVRDCYGTPILSKQNSVGETKIKIKLAALPTTTTRRMVSTAAAAAAAASATNVSGAAHHQHHQDGFDFSDSDFDFEAALLFDRIMLQEDISVGQRIRNYTITLVYDNEDDENEDDENENENDKNSSSSDNNGRRGATKEDEIITTLVSNGTSIGRKRIHLFTTELFTLLKQRKVGGFSGTRCRHCRATHLDKNYLGEIYI